jgi:hypothetical protein
MERLEKAHRCLLECVSNPWWESSKIRIVYQYFQSTLLFFFRQIISRIDFVADTAQKHQSQFNRKFGTRIA